MIIKGEQYFKGVLTAYLGANFMNGPVPEWQIDVIKEDMSRFSEAMKIIHNSHIKKRRIKNIK